MPDTKISALTAAASALAADEIPVNEAGTTKKLTVEQLAAYLNVRINGNSGAAGEYKTLQKLSANSADSDTGDGHRDRWHGTDAHGRPVHAKRGRCG